MYFCNGDFVFGGIVEEGEFFIYYVEDVGWSSSSRNVYIITISFFVDNYVFGGLCIKVFNYFFWNVIFYRWVVFIY